MTRMFSFPSLPLAPKGWTAEASTVYQETTHALAAALEQDKELLLDGQGYPIARLVLDKDTLTAFGTEGGVLTFHRASARDLASLLSVAIVPIVANQIWLSQGLARRFVLDATGMALWLDFVPFGSLSIATAGATPDTFGYPPPWRFTFQGKPSKFEHRHPSTAVEQVAAYLKKLAPRYVMREDTTGLWYKDVVLAPSQPLSHTFHQKPNASLRLVTTPDKAYSWTKQDDALIRCMSLEGLLDFSWRTEPTEPGWESAAQINNDPGLCTHVPLPPQQLSLHRFDPIHGGLTEVIDAARFRLYADTRRHHEVFIARYGAPACEVLAHVPSNAPGVDTFLAILENGQGGRVDAALAACGVSVRKNPAVQRTTFRPAEGYQEGMGWRPIAVWSLALPQAQADALHAHLRDASGILLASHPWTEMWP